MEPVDILKEIGSIPELKSAIITKNDSSSSACIQDICIKATWSCRNYSTSEKDTHVSYYVYNTESRKTLELQSTIQDKRIVLSAISPCGSKISNLFQGDECRFLSITSNGRTSNINLKDNELHGKVYMDSELSCFCWSHDSKYLAFVAEKYRSKQTDWMDKKSEKDSCGEKYAYIDDWGEQMTTQAESVIVICDSESEDVKVLRLPTGVCVGQVIWAPDGSLIGVAFSTLPYRLGLIYCRNRESRLFHLTLDQQYTELTGSGFHVNSPRFSNDGSKFAFLQSPTGGPHVRSAQLRILNWSNKTIHTLVDHVDGGADSSCVSFFGLCGKTNLPLRCWSQNDQFIVLSTPSHFAEAIFAVDVDSGEISNLINTAESHNALDVYCDSILVSISSFTAPSSLCVLVNFPSTKSQITPRCISAKGSVAGISSVGIDSWTFVNPNPHSSPNASHLPIPVLYFGPTRREDGDDKLRPLIVWAHGGPHSSISNSFNHAALFFVRLGYSIVFPNYRGSLGQGKSSLESLPGNCGTVDVSDVHEATLQCLERYRNVLDPDRVVLFGGSHGGFLVTHLSSAKYSALYKAVSARNPVIDIASMTVTTDITDWNFVESGLPYEIGRSPTAEDMARMLSMSPLSHVNEVSVPTLLLLGKNDRRVPMSQGIFYHKILLARNVPTKAYVYDDTHALSKVDVETDCLIQSALWFQKYLNLSM